MKESEIYEEDGEWIIELNGNPASRHKTKKKADDLLLVFNSNKDKPCNDTSIYFSVRSLIENGLSRKEAISRFNACANVSPICIKYIGKNNNPVRAINVNEALASLRKAIKDANYSHRAKVGIENKTKIISILEEMYNEHS